MTDTLTLPAADDLHVHLRQGDLARLVAPAVRAGGAGRVLVMPNLKPPVTSTERAVAYRRELEALAPGVRFLMTLYLSPDLTADEVRRAAAAGIVAVKSYPRGVTTNSDGGIESYENYHHIFAAMQDAGLVLCLHGEVPSDHERGICVLNAEERFLDHLRSLHRAFPRLRIVLEHVTTAAAVDCVRSLGDTVAATITVHHLDLTVDHWAGRNHNFCKPVAKYPSDRAALRAVLREGHPRFFLGSDSAPHPRHDKENACACAGVYTQPLLLAYLADACDRFGCLERLEAFACRHGAAFYGLPPATGTVTLERRPCTVPLAYGPVVPFRAGETLAWSVI
jgi:dihydroorotase